MAGGGQLKYVTGDRVKADGIPLQRLPLAAEGAQKVGELAGVLIDIEARQVRYLVVECAQTRQKHLLPLDGTFLDCRTRVLERVSPDDLSCCEPFDPAQVGLYDDDAVMSLLFGRPAA